jgi:Asp-tRNA(Asn)/Glu-tRNA(Gln) amidotransferase A subunit family amidase
MSLCALTLTQAIADIRDGRISSVELVTACLDRVAEVDADIQAWAFLDREHALAQARALDEHRALGRALGPLHGVPVGIKDIFDTGDMPTEFGSPLWAGRTPRIDAAAVARLRAAGAVIMGKTVTTEYAYFHPGKTRNPHDPERTPGGSSSGSAAAVADGMAPVALGTQTAGSVIRPAAFCGVYGFKPTHGLIPRHGILQLSRTLDHVGLFARSIDDVALLLEQLQGYDERDPDTRPRARVDYQRISNEEPPLEPMFAFIKTPHWERADADMKEAYAELQEALGAQIEEVELFPSASEGWDWQRTIMEAEMSSNLEALWIAGKDKLSERLRSLMERGRETRVIDYQRTLRRIAPTIDSFDELFRERYDAILTPPALGTAPKGLGATGDPAFCVLWTLLGMPAITLPLMQGANGLPLGVQLVGRRNYDARLLRTARWLEKKVAA